MGKTASKDVRKEVMSELSRRENEKNDQEKGQCVHRDVVEYDVRSALSRS